MDTISFNQEKCWRIIPSRFPPINLFERVTNPEDLDAIIEIESLTNDRLRDEVGNLTIVPKEDRISGPGSSYIMAAFTHLNKDGSRFSDGTWGVYYAALSLETSIAETKYHREKFLSATNEEPIRIDMRVLTARIKGELDNINVPDYLNNNVYDPDDYRNSQDFAKDLKKKRSNGIFYRSVRHDVGKNVAIFKPKLLNSCHQEQHLEYHWNGKHITHIFEKRAKSI